MILSRPIGGWVRGLGLLFLGGCAAGGSPGPVPRAPSAAAEPMAPAATRTLQLLERVTRIDSAGGREAAVARQLAEYLDTAGVRSRLIPHEPGRASLWARLGPDTGRPVVLASHLDAPPADPRRWPAETGPFDAVRRDGALVGRGVLGGKGLAVTHAHVLAELARREADLVRPVLLVAVAAGLEPDGGAAPAIVSGRAALKEAAVVLTVGGYSLIEPGLEDRMLHWATIGDPGWARVHMTAVGDETDPASARLARHLPAVLSKGPRTRLVPSTEAGMRALAGTASPLSTLPYRWAPLARLLVVPSWRETPFLSGLVRETVDVERLEGGQTAASAARARAVLRCRLLPGTDPATVRRRLRAAAPDPQVFFTLKATRGPSVSSRAPEALAARLESTSSRPGWRQALAFGLAAQPTLAPAFRALDAPVVGFWPLPVTPETWARIDRPNERVAVDLYLDAASRLRDLVLALATEAPEAPRGGS